jgi:hypothetical protein
VVLGFTGRCDETAARRGMEWMRKHYRAKALASAGLAGVRAIVGLEKDRDHDGQADQEQGCAQQFSRWTSHD